MSSGSERPYVDALSMTDREAHVYETIAVLEYGGRPTTAARIAEAAGLDGATVSEALRGLTERRAIVRRGRGEDAEYAPASHDWSAAPPDE
jgi:DNA-binding IclR family transcriptional regulator